MPLTTPRDAVLARWTGPAAVFGSWKRLRPEGTRAVLTWDKGEGVGMGDLSLPTLRAAKDLGRCAQEVLDLGEAA